MGNHRGAQPSGNGTMAERADTRGASRATSQSAPEAALRGTQSIKRAIAVLRAIASKCRDGLRLAEVAQRAHLERPTAHRILKGLCDEGVIIQDPATRRYRLGHLLFELGLAAAPQFSLRELCHPALCRLAETTGDTVFLTLRSGNDAVCIDRCEGPFPIRALLLDVGTRRPLGMGAGGIALLMALPDRTVEELVQANASRLRTHAKVNPASVLALVSRARRMGYALNDLQLTPGAVSVGLPLMNRFGEPIAAISIGAIDSRMAAERRQQLVEELRVEVAALERLLHEKPD